MEEGEGGGGFHSSIDAKGRWAKQNFWQHVNHRRGSPRQGNRDVGAMWESRTAGWHLAAPSMPRGGCQFRTMSRADVPDSRKCVI